MINTLPTTRLVFLTFGLLSLSSFHVNAKIPDDARKYGDGYYKVIKQKGISWTEAKKKCELMGGQLAVFETSAECRFAFRLMGDDKFGFWTGFLSAEKGKPTWVNGEPFKKKTVKGFSDDKLFKEGQYGLFKSGGIVIVRNAPAIPVAGFLCEWKDEKNE